MNNNKLNYPLIVSNDCKLGSSDESSRIFATSYNTYSPNLIVNSEYLATSKTEAFDHNYWPMTTTHNILSNPTITILDQTRRPLLSNRTIETLVPASSAQLSQMNSSGTISASYCHHHHIHQHVYQSSSPPTCNDPSLWINSTDYQSFYSTSNPSSGCYYSTPCSYYPTNDFPDSSKSHWASSTFPIKFESSYSPPPSYFETLDHTGYWQERVPKEEQRSSSEQSNCFKTQCLSTQLTPVPSKNALNGKTRTRDKYRIVYTDQQRCELENEFIISKYISIPRKSALSLTLSLSERQIKIWFQNRRAKERKLSKKRQEMSTTRQLNNSNDGDSPSNGDLGNSSYYQNYV